MLRTVWYKIEENRTARSEQIFRALTEKGIPCRKLEQGERTAKEAEDLRHMILLTDDRTLVKEASQEKIACVGVAGTEESFFEGADLVVEEPEELELRELEDYLFHCHGIPVIIAQSGRLTLREMIVDDWQVLDRISRQQGMEKARRDADEEDAFGKERLASYISNQYRLYGYGLWTVVLADNGVQQSEKTANESEKFQKSKEEKVIGCCGFSELSKNLEQSMPSEQPAYGAAGNSPVLCVDSDFRGFSEYAGPVLELQYMLDEAYRRRGYGTEMCRAAIAYAYEYLEAKEIWVRVRSDYPEALSFAYSLGFRPTASDSQAPTHIVWLRHERVLF